jgi:hypothetical protein
MKVEYNVTDGDLSGNSSGNATTTSKKCNSAQWTKEDMETVAMCTFWMDGVMLCITG